MFARAVVTMAALHPQEARRASVIVDIPEQPVTLSVPVMDRAAVKGFAPVGLVMEELSVKDALRMPICRVRNVSLVRPVSVYFQILPYARHVQ